MRKISNIASVVNGINPLGINDSMMHISLDEAKSFVLSNINVIENKTYTFSIWHKSDAEMKVEMNIFGNTDSFISTNTWEKFTSVFNVNDLENNTNIVFNIPIGNIYLCEASLMKGNVTADWIPAPEDIYEKIENISETGTSVADLVEAKSYLGLS